MTATLLFFLHGCAGVPVKTGFPTYRIKGIPYVSLSAICDLKGISWEYDTYSRIVNLARGKHRLNIKVGDNMVLLDGSPKRLSHPVDFYQGAVVVPLKFVEEVINPITEEPVSVERPVASNLAVGRIVIDAGHGGFDPGAIGRTGLREKDINLDIAKRLARVLKDAGIEVVMTRSIDSFISLERRVQIANDARAGLFVSIHTNASKVRSLNGFEVYYVSPFVSDSSRAISAVSDGKFRLDPACFYGTPSRSLRATLWDMTYACARSESIELARSICRSSEEDLSVKMLGVKKAAFHVLKGARMPAVLVEVGFVSNPREEKLLKNTYYRQQLADAIGSGILDYCKDYGLIRQARQ